MERRVDFFTRYDAAGASSRYRFYSYAAYLREIGWEVRLEPFFPAGYLARLYRGGGKSKLAAARALGRRLLCSISMTTSGKSTGGSAGSMISSIVW